eukprot:TRINITY_DN4400_c0_g1_i1.p1 TRINITY_DN4400_c0_g1~~TRINITY_DN4400_c0_g1_i1.p1  ORF type:complete len:1005 (-),score=153.49 TRINITY_DN4400_c0_g1_i1:239-3253(-)
MFNALSVEDELQEHLTNSSERPAARYAPEAVRENDRLSEDPSAAHQDSSTPRPQDGAEEVRSRTSLSSLFEFTLRDDSKYGLEDLRSSWLIFGLRVFHAWSFLLALTAIAAVGIHRFLGLFLEFRETLLRKGRTLERKDWLHIVATMSESVLCAFVLAGLMQRGVWLLRDSFAADMFYNYRRTICCEIPGPAPSGENAPLTHRRTVVLSTQSQLALLRSALTESATPTLKKNIVISEVTLYRDSELLALHSMAGEDHASALLSRDLPAKVTFRVPGRPTSLGDYNRWFTLRGVVDIIWQVLIYTTIDVVPLVWTCFGVPRIATSDCRATCVLTTAVISMSCVHIAVYYVWSTLLDLGWKAYSFYIMLMTFPPKCCRGLSRFEPQWLQTLRPRGDNTASPAEVELLEEGAHNLLGLPSQGRRFTTSAALDGRLNICVQLRNVMRQKGKTRFIIVAVMTLIILTTGLTLHLCRKTNSIYLVVVLVVWIPAFVILRGRCFLAGRRAVTGFVRILREHGESGAWALWCQTHCGVEPFGTVIAEIVFLILAVLLLFFCIVSGLTSFIPTIVFLCCWTTAVIITCWKYQRHLWKWVIVQSFMFGILALVSAALTYDPWWPKGGFLMALLLFSQLGLTRNAQSLVYITFIVVFVIILIAISVFTILASSMDNGMSFQDTSVPYCKHPGPNCQNFHFPVKGHRAYDFCDLSWEMGTMSGTPDSVSERCEDTRLTIVDFAHLAALAGYLPNQTLVNDSLEEYFPGWYMAYNQSYGAKDHRNSTFAHFVRGNTNVIAVRGTSSAVEVLQDMTFWMPVAFLQIAGLVGPSLFSMRSVLQMTAFKSDLRAMRSESLHDLSDYIYTLKRNLSSSEMPWFYGSKLYLTGHSLGGGIAADMAGSYNIPAVTFSAPGLMATSSLLQPAPTLMGLRRHTINVVPTGDPVPKVDDQVGTVSNIDCKFGDIRCHLLRYTSCELLYSCGDGGGRKLGRNYTRACQVCQPSGQSANQPACRRPHD